jgi:hypothetical protein
MWDNENIFSDRQTLAAASSQNIIDSGGDDLGLGEPLYLQVALSGGGSGALTVTVNTADDAGMTDAVAVATYPVAAARVAGGGVVLAAPLPTGCRRFLRLAYSGASGGLVTAGLVQAAQTSGMRK